MTKKKTKEKKDSNEKHILVIRLSAIGDVVLASSVIGLLLTSYNPSQILWLGTQPSLSLLKKSYPGVLFYDLKDPKFHHSQMPPIWHIFDLQGNLKSILFSLKIWLRDFCGYSISKKYSFYRMLLILKAKAFPRTYRISRKKQLFFQYHNMLHCVNQSLGLPKNDLASFRPKIFCSRKKSLKDLPFQKTFLAVAVGASYPSKRAPLSLIESILFQLEELVKKNSLENIPVVFVGDLRDKEFISPLLRRWKGSVNCSDYTGKASLEESAEILARACVLLTNDTGLLHISEAVGTPVVSLFGPTVEEFGFRPFLEESVAVSAPISCRPCSKHGQAYCRFDDYLCFHSLDPKFIAKKIFHHFYS